jgi:hypothetical protein
MTTVNEIGKDAPKNERNMTAAGKSKAPAGNFQGIFTLSSVPACFKERFKESYSNFIKCACKDRPHSLRRQILDMLDSAVKFMRPHELSNWFNRALSLIDSRIVSKPFIKNAFKTVYRFCGKTIPYHITAGGDILNVAIIAKSTDDISYSIKNIENLIEVSQKVGQNDDLWILKMRFNLCLLYLEAAKPKKAINNAHLCLKEIGYKTEPYGDIFISVTGYAAEAAYSLEDNETAAELFQLSSNLLAEKYGKNSASVLRMQIKAAVSLKELHRYQEAEKLLKGASKAAKMKYGELSIERAYCEALRSEIPPLSEKCLESNKIIDEAASLIPREVSDKHIDMAKTIFDISARRYMNSYRPAKAIEFFKRSIELTDGICMKICDIRRLMDAAEAYYANDSTGMCFKLLTAALDAAIRIFGKNSRLTAEIYDRIAYICLKSEIYSKSLEMLEKRALILQKLNNGIELESTLYNIKLVKKLLNEPE